MVEQILETIFFNIIDEGPGVARGKQNFVFLVITRPSMSPQKNSAKLVQPFCRLYATYIYTNILFYYIDNMILPAAVLQYIYTLLLVSHKFEISHFILTSKNENIENTN